MVRVVPFVVFGSGFEEGYTDLGGAFEEGLERGGGEEGKGAWVDDGVKAMGEGGVLAPDGEVGEPGDVVSDVGVAVAVGNEGRFFVFGRSGVVGVLAVWRWR